MGGHHITGVEVFRDRLIQETLGSNNLNLFCGERGIIDDAANTAEVVAVGMRNDDGDDGPLAKLLIDEFKRGTCRFLDRQWIDHDPTCIALDEGYVREIEAANLIDARNNLEQAVLHVEQSLTLQGWVDAVELHPLKQEVPVVHVPGHIAFIIHDLTERRGSDEAALGFLKVPLVSEGQKLALLLLRLDRVLRRHLSLRTEMLWLLRDRRASKPSSENCTNHE